MTKKPEVLSSFDGFVHTIRGDGVAHVTLIDEEGDMYGGTCPAKKLTKKGIKEGQWFICHTFKGGRAKFQAVRDQPVSSKWRQQIEGNHGIGDIGQEIIKGLVGLLDDMRNGRPIPCTTLIREGNQIRVEEGDLQSSLARKREPKPKRTPSRRIKGSHK